MFELNRETPGRTLVSTWRGGLEAREFPRRCQTLNMSVASERERTCGLAKAGRWGGAELAD